MTPPAAADTAQAGAQNAVHSSATQALAALNKLAQALKQAGVPDSLVKDADEMSNRVNEIASAAVGNAPEPEVPEAPPEQPYSPTPGEAPGGLGSAISDFAAEESAPA